MSSHRDKRSLVAHVGLEDQRRHTWKFDNIDGQLFINGEILEPISEETNSKIKSHKKNSRSNSLERQVEKFKNNLFMTSPYGEMYIPQIEQMLDFCALYVMQLTDLPFKNSQALVMDIGKCCVYMNDGGKIKLHDKDNPSEVFATALDLL